MRNLKRALSLTLASVMLLGMMVVGSSAAAGYDDVADTDNVEAIEVLQTIEVMVGDERGFGPERPVNRAEMAVVMGKLLSLDYNYYTATCPFNDVYDWARGWVGACAANGIVSGRGDGVYDPGATVTAVEAASMLMRALGYFKYQNDYADGFEVATVRQGTLIGIFDGVGSSATEPMTRNQVAQMVLNALQSGTVQPDGNTISLTTPDGVVNTGKVNYVYVTSDKAYATAISNINATSMGSVNSNPIVELGEQLYNGELKLYGEGKYISDRVWDVFGRPARKWEYKGQEIGTYEKKELIKETYTAKVTGQDLYELLGKSTIDTYNFKITIDGVETTDPIASDILSVFSTNDMYRTNKETLGRTGNGVLTQVYVDTEFEKDNANNYWVYISIINTYLAKATEDYNAKDNDVDLRVWHLAPANGTVTEYYKSFVGNGRGASDDADGNGIADVNDRPNDYRDVTVDGEDFSIVADVKEDDLYLVTVAEGEIQTIKAPEVLSTVTIDAFKLFDHVTTGGQTYNHTTTARYDVEAIEDWTSINDQLNLKDLTYNVVLDEYGYLIGLERNEDPDQYVFLTGIETGASNLYAKQVDANIIHMDGTMETVKVDMTKSTWGNPDDTNQKLTGTNLTRNLSQQNVWCTYSVSNTGVYTLKRVPVSTATNVAGGTVKAAQYAQDVAIANDDPGADPLEKAINTKRVSLKSADGAAAYVYGNDDTVYLTVSLEGVRVADDKNYIDYTEADGTTTREDWGDSRWIIDDVDSVVTGVKNANLVAAELGRGEDGYGYPEAEIYTLYNKDGIVIAAVVIGEDDGASTNYAYIHTSDLDEESYANTSATKAGDGNWTWTRKAIVNGQIVTLKEVGDNPKYLYPDAISGWEGMKQGNWYEIKYDANGNVRRATKIVNGSEDKYPDVVRDVEESVNSKDTVVLKDVTTISNLRYKNGTLYTKTDDTKGFSVDPDVKTVLILAGKQNSGSYGPSNVSIFKDTYDGYTGYAGLEKALREMNDNDGEYEAGHAVASELNEVEIAAILESGRATTIIINDKTPAPDNGRPTTPSTGTGKNVIYNINDYRNVSFYKSSTLVAADDITSAGVGARKFTATNGVVVSLYGAAGTFGSKAATGVVVGGISFNVSANGDTASFTMPANDVTLPSPAAIKAEVDKDAPAPGGDDKIDAQFKSVTLTLKDSDGKTVQVLNATDAHIIADSTEASKAPYSTESGIAAGDLYLAFDLPAGMTLSAAPTASIVAGGYTYPSVTLTAMGTSDVKGYVDTSNLPAEVTAKADTTIALEATVASTTVPVRFVVNASAVAKTGGVTVDYSNTTKGIVSSGADVRLDIVGIDDTKFAGVEAAWTVTGVTNTTKSGTSNENAVTANTGAWSDTSLIGANLIPADDATEVVVTVTFTGKTVKGALDISGLNANEKKIITAAGASDTGVTKTVGLTKGATVNLLQAGDAQKGLTLATNVKEVLVEYELSGVTAGTASGNAGLTGTAKYDSTNGLTIVKADGSEVDAASFTVDGNKPITLKITGIKEVTFDKTKFSASVIGSVGGLTSVTVAAADDIVLVEKNGAWVNKGAVTLNLTGTYTTASEKAVIEFRSGADYSGVATALVSTNETSASNMSLTVALAVETMEITTFTSNIAVLIEKNV